MESREENRCSVPRVVAGYRPRYATQLLKELAGIGVGDTPGGARESQDDALGFGADIDTEVLDRIFSEMSLEREIEAQARDSHGRWSEGTVSRDSEDPWVSRLACRLAGEWHPEGCAGLPRCRPFRVIVTHDVDRVTPTEPMSLAKSVARLMGRRRRAWLPLSDALRPRLFLRNLERLLDFELQYKIRPWFFFMAGRYGLGRFSNRYGIHWKHARETITMVQQAGGEIGLHGSYHAMDQRSYAAEAATLADIVGRQIRAHRNHYLRFDPRTLWCDLEKAGIELDFSLAFIARIGFRVPATGPFHPFDWTKNRASSVQAIPTIAMDRLWWPERKEEVLAGLRQLLEAASKVGGTVAILIHPEIMVLDPRWFSLFEEIVGVCVDVGAVLDTKPDDLLASCCKVQEDGCGEIKN